MVNLTCANTNDKTSFRWFIAVLNNVSQIHDFQSRTMLKVFEWIFIQNIPLG